ncbi:CST complex subunit STN1 [Abrus precatorius]|uniref:CST complex subunit STN1 n=1 Tax=Abrus precatorius TaxID=3816 RepID=A0A8B8M1G6_ABRPR|nr:CST complex subunit STN1 [Abrus precatorius]XP_027361744.1 CST complex subunit STN1 [Abrus precatorius]
MQKHVALRNTHVKLLGFDLVSLTQNGTSFQRRGIALSLVETLGTVTLRDMKPNKFLRFGIDDGTAFIPCILWLNHHSSSFLARRHPNPHDLHLAADAAARFAALVNIGAVVRVRGRLSSYQGAIQVTVSDVVVEKDPNAEILHWLDCVRLARHCYNLLNQPQ